ncbi:hypothetical protein BJ508DRAFT_377252 [Ascobolus immersus RN42]|uniref:MYND-type domain-containing protein n=1 Tax=Ascobolus immersus RN42 TaxID=1160509 RepID=A0A3N4I669_ASCIM|nr:hypothetical protein BJ508DRAFT_377252 [Ascobolus immersus RN42]
MASSSDTLPSLLFHGIVGNPEKRTQCISFHISCDIPKTLSDKLMTPVELRPRPTLKEIRTIKTAIEGVLDELSTVKTTFGFNKCCVCTKPGIPRSRFRPFDLDEDIKNAWDWVSKDTVGLIDKLVAPEKQKVNPIPQVWSRILPTCEGSEKCKKEAEQLAEMWREKDADVNGKVVINSWQDGLGYLPKDGVVRFTKVPITLLAFNCNLCQKHVGSSVNLKCATCQKVIYCSQACMSKDLLEHRKECKSLASQSVSPSQVVHPAKPETSPVSQLSTQLNTLNISSPATAKPIPKRRMVLDNVTLVQKDQNEAPLPMILYHGIAGNPAVPSDSELFRIIMPIPQDMFDAICPPSSVPDPERHKILLEYFGMWELMFTERLAWFCIGCGNETSTFKHHFRFREEVVNSEGLKLLPYVWDCMVPVCEDKDCVQKGEEIVDGIKGKHEHKWEVDWSREEASRKHWAKMEKPAI